METEKKEMKKINKMSLLIMAVAVLLLLIAGAAYYILHQHRQMEELEQIYELDKETLEDEFNELSLQYEGVMFSTFYLPNRPKSNACKKNSVR